MLDNLPERKTNMAKKRKKKEKVKKKKIGEKNG